MTDDELGRALVAKAKELNDLLEAAASAGLITRVEVVYADPREAGAPGASPKRISLGVARPL